MAYRQQPGRGVRRGDRQKLLGALDRHFRLPADMGGDPEPEQDREVKRRCGALSRQNQIARPPEYLGCFRMRRALYSGQGSRQSDLKTELLPLAVAGVGTIGDQLQTSPGLLDRLDQG